MKRQRIALLTVVWLTLAGSHGVIAAAQIAAGSIVGTAYDAGGAVIPGAEITLVNTGTQSARSLTTDGLGNFAAP